MPLIKEPSILAVKCMVHVKNHSPQPSHQACRFFGLLPYLQAIESLNSSAVKEKKKSSQGFAESHDEHLWDVILVRCCFKSAFSCGNLLIRLSTSSIFLLSSVTFHFLAIFFLVLSVRVV